ncbi:FtsX-like permease family protein [Arachidicoccus rhizosphaerae]|uniref:FtsX-like permease family protein n=1 Tax=Arachidicoccus rhizosphaerae TaxID=551991 RepID=A0A1H3XMW9_9BACT|nr:ABC transporter permease [Arachidicoccus rhizosphaerae]SEA00696.1 FtsX-like permease family protein [Arachidicoccus rhizosphaerae]
MYLLINNIKVAWRNLKAHRVYGLLNIAGLTIGIATSILVLIWVHYQFSFDRFHEQYASIYRLNTTIGSEDGPVTWDQGPSGLSVLTKGASGIKQVIRMKSWDDQNISNYDKSKIFDGNHIAYTDPDILKVFDFPLLYGNKESFLKDINAAAITQDLAIRLFGSASVLGKKIRYFGDIYTVEAVLKDFPKNSTLQYTAFFPMSAFSRRMMAQGYIHHPDYLDETLDNINFNDYLLLDPQVKPQAIASVISQNYARQKDQSMRFSLQPLKDLHLVSADGNPSDLRIVQMLLLVAIVILVVACINYMNLTTARSLTRVKEVAVRRMNGANKSQLFNMFMTEAGIVFLIATAFSLVLVYSLLPYVSRFTGAWLSVVEGDAVTLLMITAVLISTLLLATVFPAYLLSGLGTVSGLKGGVKEGRYAVLRKALVILQFGATFILLMGAIVVHKQMHFLSTKDIGFDRSYAFVAPMTNNMVDKGDELEAELLKNPAIQGVGVADVYDLSGVQNSTSDVIWPGKPDNDKTLFTGMSGDKAFIDMMKFHFVAGGNFTGDASDSNKFIVNEAAAKRMALRVPYVGQKISYAGVNGELIGVVRDFNYAPLTQKIGPLIMDSRGFKNILYVRTTAGTASSAIQQTERLYKAYSGNAPFSYSFLDKRFAEKYEAEQRAGSLLNAFSVVALIISCMGLFGLALYTAEVKRKEIGIRKVLGANIKSIIGLITGQFLRLVFLGVLIGMPVAYLITARWQNHFAYKASVGVFSFLAGALTIVGITILTVLFIAIKSATVNPVNSLKSE